MGPAALLALMPKCPLCVAGYVAAATGLGVSVTAAAYMRSGAIALCVVVLGLATSRSLWRLVTQYATRPNTDPPLQSRLRR